MSLSDATIDRLRQVATAVPSTERYEVLEAIGRGGMGVVYRVRDRVLAREAALKVMGDRMHDEAMVRLQREAAVLAMLEHPGIVPVHDLGLLPDGRPYYVMKLVRGETLADRISAGMPAGEALRAFIRVCETVAFAHAHGVVHRDLTPRNIMLGTFGDVLVLDWGVAKVTGSADLTPLAGSTLGATGDGAIIGTPGYMAPEQHGWAGEVDARADVFALGRVLAAIVAETPPPLRSVIAKATAAAPADRYPDAASLAHDVGAYLDGLPVLAHRESVWERLGRQARRHRLALSLIGVYLVVRALMLLAFDR
jgi:serine/threonine protein kinase